MRMLVIRSLRMKLDPIDRLRPVHHRLYHGSRRLREMMKPVGNPGQFLPVRFSNHQVGGQAIEQWVLLDDAYFFVAAEHLAQVPHLRVEC